MSFKVSPGSYYGDLTNGFPQFAPVFEIRQPSSGTNAPAAVDLAR